MMFKYLAPILFLFSTQVLAFSCTCGSASFSNADIIGAVNKGYSVNSDPRDFGGAYPHRFGNREHVSLPHCTGTDYIEYPLKNGAPYTSGPPGADRVVYLRGPGKQFCGCMTHRGASRPSEFVNCNNS